MRISNEIQNEHGESDGLLQLAADLVSAYVVNNRLDAVELPRLIEKVYTTLRNLGQEGSGPSIPLEPAVPVRKSITNDYIICLEDGKKLKTLKRHLRATYDMTPEQYRERWGLPFDYPMVAPSYAKKRSSLAKINGLGHFNKRPSSE